MTTVKAMDRYPSQIPPQDQQNDSHGTEHEMTPRPYYTLDWYKGSDKLKDSAAIITGGDSGIGRSVAVLYVCNFANVWKHVITDQNNFRPAKERMWQLFTTQTTKTPMKLRIS